MIDLILEMWRTPEAQADAYTWAAALFGHFAIGVLGTAVIGWLLGAWRGAWFVSLAFLVFWEGGQILYHNGELLDGLVDAVAVAAGAFMAAGAWTHRAGIIGVAAFVLLGLGIAGVRRRK